MNVSSLQYIETFCYVPISNQISDLVLYEKTILELNFFADLRTYWKTVHVVRIIFSHKVESSYCLVVFKEDLDCDYSIIPQYLPCITPNYSLGRVDISNKMGLPTLVFWFCLGLSPWQ